MAAVTSAAIGAGTTLYSASQARRGANNAANAQQQAADAAIAEQQRQYDLSRQDQQPWMQAGQNALGQMQALNAGDFSSFQQSPDYQFAMDQGMQALDRGAAARGGLYAGGADADRIAFGQGLASQQYGNYYNRLAGIAGMGQGSANALGALGANSANQIGGNLMGAGNARASAYTTGANANINAANQLGQLGGFALGQWQQQNQASNHYVPGGLRSSAYTRIGG